MAFLFKSKKQEREKAAALASREREAASSAAGSTKAARGKDDKSSLQRSTPTGSLNSFDTDGHSGSPDQGGPGRRGPSMDQQPAQQPGSQLQQQVPPSQQSDLPVSNVDSSPPPVDAVTNVFVLVSFEMDRPYPTYPTRMPPCIPGLNGDWSIRLRIRVRSLDMAPPSTLWDPRRAMYISWVDSSTVPP